MEESPAAKIAPPKTAEFEVIVQFVAATKERSDDRTAPPK
jgi:hypothetical protein